MLILSFIFILKRFIYHFSLIVKVKFGINSNTIFFRNLLINIIGAVMDKAPFLCYQYFMINFEKLERLKEFIRNAKKAAVAFSGGIDSGFLVKLCRDILKDNLVALAVDSQLMKRENIIFIKEYCASINVNLRLINLDILRFPQIVDNGINRCYFCKKAIFTEILREAGDNGVTYVFDGSNADDVDDYRPGSKALEELKIISPLAEVKIKKKEVREFAKIIGVPFWDKLSDSCLASRIPYDDKITTQRLLQIENGEKYVRSLGFNRVRLRNFGDVAILEVGREERNKLFSIEIFDNISKYLLNIGFKYATISATGYIRGSFNEFIKNSGGVSYG